MTDPSFPPAKSDIRRTDLLDHLADHVLAEGLMGSSLRPLARAAGVSDRMLLYYFPDKAAVIAATLERIAQRLMPLLAAQVSPTPLPLDALRRQLLAFVLDDAMWPYMRLWLEIAAQAARGDPLLREVGGSMARGFLAWGAAQLDCFDDATREVDAALLLATIEGMVLLKSVGLDEVCQAAL